MLKLILLYLLIGSSMRFKLRRKNYRYLLLLSFFLSALFLLALLTRWGGAWIDKLLLVQSRPATSLSTDKPLAAEILFNNEAGTEIFSDRLIQEIGQTRKSLEIAMYSFTSVRLKTAVYAAANRGEAVTIITDFRKHDQHAAFFADAPVGIKFLEAGAETDNKTILMHHKFVLIDRGQPNQRLIFGSYNWTDLQEKYDPSFLLMSGQPELVASFGREFDRLAAGQAGIQKLQSRSYHPWDLSLQAAGKNYEVWFSPGREGDGIKNRLSSLINGAQQSLKIMIWDFTDKDLAVDLVRQARAGIHVTLLTDTWNFNNQTSVFKYLAAAKQRYRLDNLELIVDRRGGEQTKALLADANLDKNFDPFLHYHVLIADDRQVLFGTNNWSRAGSFYNDESMMVSDDPALVNRFLQAFAYQYRQNAAP